MFIAAYKGHTECIEVLARLGGNVNVSVSGVSQAAVPVYTPCCVEWRFVMGLTLRAWRRTGRSHQCSLQHTKATKSVSKR